MPPKMRLWGKKDKRTRQVHTANARQKLRYDGIVALNTLVKDLDVALPRLDAKNPARKEFEKILRVLSRRCQQEPFATRLRNSVQSFLKGGGCLPDGITLHEHTGALHTTSTGQDNPLMLRHKVLRIDFVLKSSAFMLTYHSDNFTADTWPPFRAFAHDFAKNNGARAWSACLEESEKFHTHAYFIWTDGVGLRMRGREPLTFEGVQPRVDICTAPGPPASGGFPRPAALHGLWYVAVLKKGTVQSDANFLAWRDYKPLVPWLLGLWDMHKLSHVDFLNLSAKFRSGHAKRKRDVDEIVRHEQEKEVMRHVEKELAEIHAQTPLKPIRTFPLAANWVNGFREPARRRPILVIVGGTSTGRACLRPRCCATCVRSLAWRHSQR
jgi:hypothetical protein